MTGPTTEEIIGMPWIGEAEATSLPAKPPEIAEVATKVSPVARGETEIKKKEPLEITAPPTEVQQPVREVATISKQPRDLGSREVPAIYRREPFPKEEETPSRKPIAELSDSELGTEIKEFLATQIMTYGEKVNGQPTGRIYASLTKEMIPDAEMTPVAKEEVEKIEFDLRDEKKQVTAAIKFFAFLKLYYSNTKITKPLLARTMEKVRHYWTAEDFDDQISSFLYRAVGNPKDPPLKKGLELFVEKIRRTAPSAKTVRKELPPQIESSATEMVKKARDIMKDETSPKAAKLDAAITLVMSTELARERDPWFSGLTVDQLKEGKGLFTKLYSSEYLKRQRDNKARPSFGDEVINQAFDLLIKAKEAEEAANLIAAFADEEGLGEKSGLLAVLLAQNKERRDLIYKIMEKISKRPLQDPVAKRITSALHIILGTPSFKSSGGLPKFIEKHYGQGTEVEAKPLASKQEKTFETPLKVKEQLKQKVPV